MPTGDPPHVFRGLPPLAEWWTRTRVLNREPGEFQGSQKVILSPPSLISKRFFSKVHRRNKWPVESNFLLRGRHLALGSPLRERVLHHHPVGNKASSVLFIPDFTDHRPGDGHHAFAAPRQSGKMIESIVFNALLRPGRANDWLLAN